MEKKTYLLLSSILLVFFLVGCDSFTLPQSGQGAYTETIGGKGVQVRFLANQPPLDEIRGPFTLAIQFLNYNTHEVLINEMIVGVTNQELGMSPFRTETISLERALTTRTAQGVQFNGPGKVATYSGAGFLLRNGVIDYGVRAFNDVAPPGTGTQFYVDMEMDYISSFPFQFCAFDVLEQTSVLGLGCKPVETLSGSSDLGFSVDTAPVIVESIEKKVTTGRSASFVTLDITLADVSTQERNEQGEIVRETLGSQEIAVVTFELYAVGTVDAQFTCTSRDQLYGGGGSTLEVDLSRGKTEITCTGSTLLLEEQLDYPYEINLYYPYHQRISTPYIEVRSNQPRSFANQQSGFS